jgi:hypothetical protein
MRIAEDKAPLLLEPEADCVVPDQSFGRELRQATFRIEQHRDAAGCSGIRCGIDHQRK